MTDRGIVRYVYTALAMVLLIAGCSSSESETLTTTSPSETVATTATSPTVKTPIPTVAKPSSSEGDAAAQLACSHFFNVARDSSAGILTTDELRQKLKEVNDDAKISDVSGVRSAAQAMLAAATSESADAFTEAVTKMGDACRGAGF